jgi:hypothetical protein
VEQGAPHQSFANGYRHYLELCTFMSGGGYDDRPGETPDLPTADNVAQTISMMAYHRLSQRHSTLANA